ncbi:DUF72 domain-containing protein [Caldibacillus lycopersici]|uniref:DUF72 domain-containing protein n=1 Tax=Perspicuibacillus lycopersici TaxID=1325689 RepID=A0AAE3LMD8_9BACI|nr:DUF72 domain-containing protein [Perspicuibacillus lycopersici]MCU9612836.1 DUF72 domain-containing protein [Perspicuibacillus lycopersici]
MIYIGLTGWGDHDRLYDHPNERNKLQVYAAHFPIVEVDTSFYAIQPIRNSEKWVRETPSTFQFIVKAYQGMTGHSRGRIPFQSKIEMFQAFKQSLQPYIEANKLAMVLFQFPPWFSCTKENVLYLRWCKLQMEDIPCALEFRNQTWFSPAYYKETMTFMKKEKWIHSVCDEPQAGEGSVPLVLQTTHPKTLVRMHGRNIHGWNHHNRSQEDWREVRYLYRYNEQELEEWKNHLQQLQKDSMDVYMLFNNNSGGDAADNAKMMIELLGIEYHGLAPRQLDLF